MAMAASVDLRSNANTHSSPPAFGIASRSRKRKQMHTPRSDQDSDECEFIEYRYVVPFANKIKTEFSKLSTPDKNSQLSLSWSAIDSESDCNNAVSDCNADVKMEDGNEMHDSCVANSKESSEPLNLCKVKVDKDKIKNDGSVSDSVSVSETVNESFICNKNADFMPSMGMTVHLVPAQKTSNLPTTSTIEINEQIVINSEEDKKGTTSPTHVQMPMTINPEIGNGAPNSETLENSKENDVFHSEFDSSQQFHRTVLSVGLRPKTKRRKRNYLAGALGLTMDDLSQDVVLDRKRNIHMKLRQGGILRFTLEEEYDIHSRAEAYSLNIVPDLNYYVMPSDKENSNARFVDAAASGRKRRKHLAVIDNYILISPLGDYYPEYDNIVTLSNGVKLLRPPTKLVELVAEAINDSPDGMLQVQQVYLSLQNRYPFYRYMDKASITSWRSSIRHALYQKWFKKIAFGTELINCKGCYWAINRKQKPKEWMMPPRREQPPAEYLSDGGMDDNDFYLPSTRRRFDMAFFMQNAAADEQDLDDSGDEELLTENSALSNSQSTAAYNMDLPTMVLTKGSVPNRDPDPMFNVPSMSQKSELQYDIANNDATTPLDCVSTVSDEATLDAWGYEWSHHAVTTNQPISDDDSGYFGQMPWCASDAASTYDQCLAYQAPLLPPTMVPYPVVPPLEFADIDGNVSELYTQDHNAAIVDYAYGW